MFAYWLTFNPRSKATNRIYWFSLEAVFGCRSKIRIRIVGLEYTESAPLIIYKNAPLSKFKLRMSSLDAGKRSVFIYYSIFITLVLESSFLNQMKRFEDGDMRKRYSDILSKILSLPFTKDSSPREKASYIRGLRARIGCEPLSEHSTRSDRVTDIGCLLSWGASPLPVATQDLQTPYLIRSTIWSYKSKSQCS